MRRSRSQFQRLVYSSLKPLAALLLLALLYTWTRSSPSSPGLSSGRSKNKKPPKPHPGISHALVIAATTSSNLTWLGAALERTYWMPYVYVTDSTPSSLLHDSHVDSSPSSSSSFLSNTNTGTDTSANTKYAPLSVPKNKGNEAMVYLTYIIDHYLDLPDVTFFHHHHGQAWHQQFTSLFELERLEGNLEKVVREGYVSPRCLGGCENVIVLGSSEIAPLGDLGRKVKETEREVLIASLLGAFWRGGEVPAKIAAPCCAQFAVSKSRILATELGTWKALRDWLMETEVGSAAAGRVLEYTWHLWFGMGAVFCPSEKKCLCDVYGVGDCGEREL